MSNVAVIPPVVSDPTALARSLFQKTPRSTKQNGYCDPVLACIDNMEFLRSVPDDHCKLIVTSPPYNLGKDYETRSSLDDYLNAQARVIEECVRILHPHFTPTGVYLLAGWELRSKRRDNAPRYSYLSPVPRLWLEAA